MLVYLVLNVLIEKYHFLECYLLCDYHWYIVEICRHLLAVWSQVQGRCWYLVQMITRLIAGGGGGIVTSCLITKHWFSLSLRCVQSPVWHCPVCWLADVVYLLNIRAGLRPNIDPYDWTTLRTTSLYIVMGNLWSHTWFYSGRPGRVIYQTIGFYNLINFLTFYYDTARTAIKEFLISRRRN